MSKHPVSFKQDNARMICRMSVAYSCRSLMAEQGIDDERLAQMSGRHIKTVRELLNLTGNPEMETIADVLLALGVAAHLKLGPMHNPEADKDKAISAAGGAAA